MTESRKTEKTHRQMTWTRLSDTSKENENAGIYENTSSIEVLQKILPKQSLSILEMILKAYDNDLVRATESLMLENGMLRFPAVYHYRKFDYEQILLLNLHRENSILISGSCFYFPAQIWLNPNAQMKNRIVPVNVVLKSKSHSQFLLFLGQWTLSQDLKFNFRGKK